MQRKRRRKNEERKSKKLLGICIFLMGLMIFSVLPVQAAAPRMYTIQPGKTWTRYDITGDGKKDRIKVVRKKVSMMGAGTVQIFM